MTRKIRVDTANMHRERWPDFAVPILAVKLRNSAFCGGYGSRGVDGLGRRAEIVDCNVSLQGWRLDVRRVTRTGADWVAAPDGIFPTAWHAKGDATLTRKSPTGKAAMTANAVRFAAGLALGAFAAPLPVTAQYFPPVLLVVPPAAQNYATPKAAPKPTPDKPQSAADTAPSARPKGHYQGQTFVPD